MIKSWFIIAVFSVLAAPQAYSQFYLNQDISLANIDRLLLVVEFSGDTSNIEGLSTEAIEQEAVRKLRGAGLQLLSERSWAQTAGQPYLNVRINSINSGLGFYVYRIETGLHQEVSLIREPEKKSIVATWQRGELGFAGENRLVSIQEDALRHVDLFIEAYKQQNADE